MRLLTTLKVIGAVAATGLLVATSCGPKRSDIATTNKTFTAKTDLASAGNFAIPANAGNKMADRQAVLYMEVTTTSSSADKNAPQLTPAARQSLRQWIETQMPQLKRFSVYSIFNVGAKRLVQVLDDQGRMEPVPDNQLPKADVLLSIAIDVQSSMAVQQTVARDSIVTYKLDTKAQLQDAATMKILASRNFVVAEQRNVIAQAVGRNPDGTTKYEFQAGFDPDDPNNINSVLQMAGREVLAKIAAMLGEYYPVTGRVTGVQTSAGRMVVDRGIEQGITNETQMLVWVDDNGIPTGIAYANCEAMAGRCVLNVYRWNNLNAAAKALVSKVQSDPNAAKELQIFATTVGLPLPQQWTESAN